MREGLTTYESIAHCQECNIASVDLKVVVSKFVCKYVLYQEFKGPNTQHNQ